MLRRRALRFLKVRERLAGGLDRQLVAQAESVQQPEGKRHHPGMPDGEARLTPPGANDLRSEEEDAQGDRRVQREERRARVAECRDRERQAVRQRERGDRLDEHPAVADDQEQAADQVSISNSIGSLRFLGAIDWREFVETMSVVETVLRQDPSGIYGAMEFATRDRYRHATERIAKEGRLSQAGVAAKAGIPRDSAKANALTAMAIFFMIVLHLLICEPLSLAIRIAGAICLHS